MYVQTGFYISYVKEFKDAEFDRGKRKFSGLNGIDKKLTMEMDNICYKDQRKNHRRSG